MDYLQWQTYEIFVGYKVIKNWKMSPFYFLTLAFNIMIILLNTLIKFYEITIHLFSFCNISADLPALMQTSGATTTTSLTWPFIPTLRKISSGTTTQYYIILSTILLYAYRCAAAANSNFYNDFYCEISWGGKLYYNLFYLLS